MGLRNDNHVLYRLGRSWGLSGREGEGVVQPPQAAESKGRKIWRRN